MTDHISINGANRFVGRALSRMLLRQGIEVRGVIRSQATCESGVHTSHIEGL
jgi:UDP-glucose 4-epimerase